MLGKGMLSEVLKEIYSLNVFVNINSRHSEIALNSSPKININFPFESFQEGSIGHELVIRPLPSSLSKAEDGSAHHVIFKRDTSLDSSESETLSDFAYMEPDRMQKRFRRSTDQMKSFARDIFETKSRSKRAIPHVIYPEILVIVDYDGYRLHGGDNIQVSSSFVS